MERYPEVPQWWFITMFVIMVAMGFVTVLVWDTKLTWWAYVVAIIISAAWMVSCDLARRASETSS